MILNPHRLMQGVGPGMPASHALRLIEHFFVGPLSEQFDFYLTSAWRSSGQQASLTDSAGVAVDPTRKAKGLSQHELGEAIDFVPQDRAELLAMWEWSLEHLRPWQAILELDAPRCIHLSLPSVSEVVKPKRLMHFGKAWQFWKGEYPLTFKL